MASKQSDTPHPAGTSHAKPKHRRTYSQEERALMDGLVAGSSQPESNGHDIGGNLVRLNIGDAFGQIGDLVTGPDKSSGVNPPVRGAHSASEDDDKPSPTENRRLQSMMDDRGGDGKPSRAEVEYLSADLVDDNQDHPRHNLGNKRAKPQTHSDKHKPAHR